MKSSNPSLRRLAFAAAVLAAGNFALAQSSTTSSDQSGSNSSNATQNSSDQSGTNSSSSNAANYNSNNTNSNDRSSMASDNDSNSSSKDKLSWTDRRFVKKAAEDGQAEVAIAQLAAQKASNQDVREFAQQMVNDHTQANQQLMSLASQKNVKIDEDDATKDRSYRRLSKTSGNDFDREFVDHMVDEHEKDIRLFQKESQKAKDPDIKQFASSTLPTLQEHLQHVQQLQQSIIPTGNEPNSGYSKSNKNSSSDNMGSTNSSSANGTNSWKSSNSSNASGSASNPGTSAGASSSTSTTK